MRHRPRLLPKKLACLRRTEVALLAFAGLLSNLCAGCLSNEYVIPGTELARLAQLPPEQRGERVHVVQGIGERRGDAIDTSQPQPPQPAYEPGGPPAPPPEGYVEGGPEPQVGVGVIIAPVPLVPPLPPGPHNLVTGRGPGPRAVPGAPMGRVPRGAAPSGGKPSGGKLGKSSGKDDLVALIVVVAVLATVGMVATEGARYDGDVAMYAWQPVHLQEAGGLEREIPLAQLTPAEAAATTGAKVMDDEGWGLLRLGRRPLDRHGFAFKMDIGGFHSWNSSPTSGMGLHLQLGYFPHPTLGILAGWSFATGSAANDNTFIRNDFALEAQFFPVGIWRLHPGLFGHAGPGYVHVGDASYSGMTYGGGLILEIALTTRLALAFRADHTLGQVANNEAGWASVSTFTGGVAIY
jgi:hypothetical protein